MIFRLTVLFLTQHYVLKLELVICLISALKIAVIIHDMQIGVSADLSVLKQW